MSTADDLSTNARRFRETLPPRREAVPPKESGELLVKLDLTTLPPAAARSAEVFDETVEV